jgi:hypothetical protein
MEGLEALEAGKGGSAVTSKATGASAGFSQIKLPQDIGFEGGLRNALLFCADGSVVAVCVSVNADQFNVIGEARFTTFRTANVG